MRERLAEIAVEAGREILAVYAQNDVGAQGKADGSPVTKADRLAEAVILKGLAALAPDIPVVAEEEVSAGRTPDVGARFFLVDPLDGTKEFISKNGEFTVNIALIENGAPVLGVVYAPALKRIYDGAEDGARTADVDVDAHAIGAWRTICVRKPDDAGLAVVASRSHLTDETRAFIERFDVADMVSAGSSLKFCKVAEGAADLYPRLARTMEWDTAAGDAVLRAAGGGVSTMDGEALRYGKRNQADDVDFANPWFVASGGVNPFEPSSPPVSA